MWIFVGFFNNFIILFFNVFGGKLWIVGKVFLRVELLIGFEGILFGNIKFKGVLGVKFWGDGVGVGVVLIIGGLVFGLFIGGEGVGVGLMILGIEDGVGVGVGVKVGCKVLVGCGDGMGVMVGFVIWVGVWGIFDGLIVGKVWVGCLIMGEVEVFLELNIIVVNVFSIRVAIVGSIFYIKIFVGFCVGGRFILVIFLCFNFLVEWLGMIFIVEFRLREFDKSFNYLFIVLVCCWIFKVIFWSIVWLIVGLSWGCNLWGLGIFCCIFLVVGIGVCLVNNV